VDEGIGHIKRPALVGMALDAEAGEGLGERGEEGRIGVLIREGQLTRLTDRGS